MTSGEDDDRAVIEFRAELSAMTDEAIAAINARLDLTVFVRAGMLVTIMRDGTVASTKWLKRSPGSPIIIPITQTHMLGLLDKAARWVKYDKRSKRETNMMPPGIVAAQIMARTGWPFRYLANVIETPTIRPDGSILDEQGYDEATCILHLRGPHAARFPHIPERPTSADVGSACRKLLEAVSNFPFISEGDKAAFVACVLSIIARASIDGPVPMFPIRAPTAGTGKSLLAQIIGIIGTGRASSAMAMCDPDEMRKRLTAIAMSGAAVVLLDNVSGSVGHDVLANALTLTVWEDRLLGRTEMVRLPLTAVWLLTGNNVGFHKTMARRIVPIDLDAKVEHPEDRTGFAQNDILAYVKRERPQLVTAALTILRGFAVAGRPAHGATKMGSYERWDDQIRSAVIWAGLADPAAVDNPSTGRGRIRAQADDDLADLAALLAALRREFGGEPWTAASALKQCATSETLRAAIEMAAPPKKNQAGGASIHSLRYLLRSVVDRPVSGLVLVRAGNFDDRQQRFTVADFDA